MRGRRAARERVERILAVELMDGKKEGDGKIDD